MNNEYELVMIATHQDDSTVGDLLHSIYATNDVVKLLIVLVSQVDYNPVYPVRANIVLHTLRVEKMGTSKARNLGLNHLINADIKASYILFPDDDSSFDHSYFHAFKEIANTGNCYIGPIYNKGTKDHYLSNTGEHGMLVSQGDHSLIGCPNQLLPYEYIKTQIYFNEKLGPGTPYGSCEDLDLFLRLNQHGNKYFFHKDLYSFHPAKHGKYDRVSLKHIIARFRSYSQGYCYIIFKYGFYSKLPNYFLRTFAGMLVFLLRLNLKLAYAYFVQLIIRIRLSLRFALDKELIDQI